MIRDERTKALINSDADALYKYKAERDKARKMMKMETDIEWLKQRVETLAKLVENQGRKE